MDTTLEPLVSHKSENYGQLITRLLATVVALLAILAVINVYSEVKEEQRQRQLIAATNTLEGTLERVAVGVEAAETRAAARDVKLKALGRLATKQDDLISELISSYQQDAYDNPNLDRITEQQLIAAEYHLTALQLLALQNSEIIRLLAVTP